MLFNFCDPRLRPEIECSNVSTEGYEVTNLISGSRKGFLAYSCIKPPIHIDITFLCNIQINHILIWPSVGSQKSSGFRLYSKNTNDGNTPYTLLSNGYLSSRDAGLLFHPADIDSKQIFAPANFLKRYIKVSMRYFTANTHSLRITICKTENSVPALARIEVWGTVSPRCGKDVVASVYTLWYNHQNTFVTECKSSTNFINTPDNIITNRQKNQISLEIPEHFLDPITCEMMTQPIILPSGKIIDQTTLEKHEQHEAVWGRPVSDPFTAVPFNEERRPIMATALKLRIDKFLLENSNSDEIKNMPRVLGRAPSSIVMRDRRILEIPRCVLNKNSLKRTNEDAKLNVHKQMTNDTQRTKKYCHKLPAVITCPKRTTANVYSNSKQVVKNLIASPSTTNNSRNCNDNKSEKLPNDIEIISDNRINALFKETNIKRFSASEKVELHNISNNCKCCSDSILYRLPCKHVICRKVLLSIENSQCNSCGHCYKSSDVERVHDNILSI
ncbi:RING finger protein 37 [Odontomachus brunneus]|uniref:RING finger protein 37 n=1 Tax=Odontomachus brunneus TaxID=486640 RepID=UPI0013F1F152|nr:RING finger protein 37 [Odontomachus brunneus]